MSQTNLISLERAKLNIPGAQASDERTIDALIGACSDAIQKYCRRDFAVRSYDELYDGNGDRRLMLRQYPLISVESVRYRPVTVIKVINNDRATNQQARVTITQTGLTLLRVASGVRVVDTSISWTAYPTLQAVAAAIVALGNGWSAQAVGETAGDYGTWPSADLYIPPSYGSGTTSQGALTARGENAELKLHTYELAGYQWDVRGWLLRAIPYTDPELLHPEDPGRLIIADGLEWGTKPIPGLAKLKIAQSTRGYDPVQLSHYKASWMKGSDHWPEPACPMKGPRGEKWDKSWLRRRHIEPWKALERKGVGIHVGEWGAHHYTPHKVVLAWMRDYLELWKEAGWGWALWNFRGSFGILDSQRCDVAYEDFKGHKLDRKMLESLWSL